MKSDALRVAAFVALIGGWSETAGACFAGPPSPEALVARAAVIVVAIARRPAQQPAWPVRPRIEFSCAKRHPRRHGLWPGYVPSPLLIEGTVTPDDDFTDRPSPYDFVRPRGRGGSCYATEYREGARFLLLLNRAADGSLTPYWAALAPTNEQLHPGDDPWLAAVRAFATSGRRR